MYILKLGVTILITLVYSAELLTDFSYMNFTVSYRNALDRLRVHLNIFLFCYNSNLFYLVYFYLMHSLLLFAFVPVEYCVFVLLTDNASADSNDITEHAHDDKPRPYLCTVCDKRFMTKKSLNRHKQTHTVDKLYSCTQCQKRFATQRYLRIHMNVHSSKYKCTECGKCFSSNACLLYTSPSPRD